MTPYPSDVERAMKEFAESLRENDRRRYAAVEAFKLGRGGVAYVSRLLNLDPKTVLRGRHDLEAPDASPKNRVRRPGGGRKRRLDREPDLDDDFHRVLAERTAGSPTDAALVWTDLTAKEIAAALSMGRDSVGVHVVDQLLKRHGYHRRKPLRNLSMTRHPDRDAQFAVVAGLRRTYLDSLNPILSIDLKARELIGPYRRAGALYTRRPGRTYDHDFPQFADGVVLPHGIYDLKRNLGHVRLGTSHDTCESACGHLAGWWEDCGRAAYPGARSILILCDGGGSNPADTEKATAHLFKDDLQRLADRTGLEIRMAHYPPYASKYNPIEHRLFPHLTRVCQGVVFTSVGLVAELMRKARTATGLAVTVEVCDTIYQLGRKVSEAAKQALHIVRDDVLPRWNYRILPHGT